MNAEQAKAKAAVMLAFAEGKTIECRSHSSGPYGKWYTTSNPEFTFSHYDYRVKVEPRTWYALEWVGNKGQLFCLSTTREMAENYKKAYALSESIHIVELTEKV